MLLPKSKNRLQPRGRPYTGHLPFAAPRGSDGSATNGAATMSQTDPADLTAALIRCPSVTPDEGGALVLLKGLLEEAGFTCTRVDKGGIANLYARWGEKRHAKTFGFNGHTDVVPIGNPDDWSADPFGAEIRDGVMFG